MELTPQGKISEWAFQQWMAIPVRPLDEHTVEEIQAAVPELNDFQIQLVIASELLGRNRPEVLTMLREEYKERPIT